MAVEVVRFLRRIGRLPLAASNANPNMSIEGSSSRRQLEIDFGSRFEVEIVVAPKKVPFSGMVAFLSLSLQGN